MLTGMHKNLAIITERMCKEQGEQKEYFTVKVLDIVRHVPVDEIMFFETSARTHRIELHAKNDCIDLLAVCRSYKSSLESIF